MGIISWFRKALANARAEIVAKDAVRAARQDDWRPPWVRDVGPATFADRLTDLFDQHRLGQISLAEYASGVLEEQEDCHEAILLRRQCRSEMGTAEFEVELEELEENLEECRWRLKWIAAQQRKADFGRGGFLEKG